jgi:hypothetical protein
MARASAKTAQKKPREIQSFEEFWPYYLAAHHKQETQTLHVLGTTIGILGVAVWLRTGRRSYLATGIAGAYGSAWLGHFAFERNRPATFNNPLWSLMGDLRMYRLWLTGELDNEMERVFGTHRLPGR